MPASPKFGPNRSWSFGGEFIGDAGSRYELPSCPLNRKVLFGRFVGALKPVGCATQARPVGELRQQHCGQVGVTRRWHVDRVTCAPGLLGDKVARESSRNTTSGDETCSVAERSSNA